MRAQCSWTDCACLSQWSEDVVSNRKKAAERVDRLHVGLDLLPRQLLEEQDEVQEGQGVQDPALDQVELHVDPGLARLPREEPLLHAVDPVVERRCHGTKLVSASTPTWCRKEVVRWVNSL